ncbi:Gamma-tubulin complex component 4 [Phytophthora pseudosyringae]|uniref:Spindle pole body component n=1 Tax=Phytophthora pseudosyringae TaxID=221518 RepID=A0A8T1VM56_9STRA|nr:Gamma-tubulin complex component 4 [Phytophthora pseudosyringae]
MHHELFLALLGHTGDVVERRADGFFVRKEASFLSQAQRSVLERLLRLGFAFATLDQFVRQASKLPSVYLHALAQAVERLLHRYADAVVELEAKTLRASAVFPMSNLMFELEEFLEVLPEVCGLVHRLTAEAQSRLQQEQPLACVKGAKLLSVVYQSTSSGFPRVRKCMQELLYACHRVLLKQMMAWMVYGEIVDPHMEFFIKKQVDAAGAGSTIVTDRALLMQDGNAAAVLWHQQFTMDLEAVPLDYFPTSVAESVFVIGKAVHILTRAHQFSPREVQDVIMAMSDLARRPVFDVVAVEHDVEKVRRHVASRLHEEVVVKSDFVGYLHVLKGFFLLSRGEVFQTFIERSFDMMLVKPTTKSEEDVNHGVWREVVRDLISEDEPWGRDFDMQLPLQTFALKGFSSSDNMLLFNMTRGPHGKYLAMTIGGRTQPRDEAGVEESGSVWWRHAQMDGNSFSSEFSLQWEQNAFWRGSHRASLLLRNEGPLGPATLVNGSFELDDPQAFYVSVDLAIEHLPGDMNGMRVMAQVKPSCGGENGILSSPVVEVPMADGDNPALRVRIQYARQEVTQTSSKQVMYKKMMAVVVNDVLVLETQIDLQQALRLHAATGEYWMGLGASSLVRLTDWGLDKYSAKTSWREGSGSNLKENNTAVTPRELWHSLNLRCNVRWPLQLLVTPDLLRSYGHLFQFCFRLKRVAYALELAWKSSTLRSKHSTGKGATFAAGALRIRMSFVVRTLELHFQVFVIEGKFKKCVEQIKSAGDFDRAKRVHETFVASVVKSCYVHTKTVASALDELLGCCWQFAEYVLQQDAAGDGGAELSADRIALLDQDFHRRFEFLYSVLQISEARDLLFLLDSNGFFASERERRKQQQQQQQQRQQ